MQPDDMENSMCFEVLGLDIFLDDEVKPWLFEVNSLASFATDSPLDKRIKFDLMYETMVMLNMSPKRKRQMKKNKAEQQIRRQYKDPVPSKDERALQRKKLQAERDKYDLMICTGYVRVFPSDDPEKMKTYTNMLEQSKMLFKDLTGVKAYVPPVRTDSKNGPKTSLV